jgi:hypothetical protein
MTIENSDVNATIIEKLLTKVPEFQNEYRKHVAVNQEILPYVLFDEFSRFVIEECRYSLANQENPLGHRDVVTRSIEFLDDLLRSCS